MTFATTLRRVADPECELCSGDGVIRKVTSKPYELAVECECVTVAVVLDEQPLCAEWEAIF